MPIDVNLSIILQNRKACKKILDAHSLEQLNVIPQGFHNNILWNCAHIIAVSQRLTYGLADQPFALPEVFVSRFSPGTKPDDWYDHDFVQEIKTLLFTSFEKIQEDITHGKFDIMKPFMTALKFEINNPESAVAFIQFHEALHMGHILNIRKFLT